VRGRDAESPDARPACSERAGEVAALGVVHGPGARATWEEAVGWRLTLADGTTVGGLDGILNRYGTQGWDLVGILDVAARGGSRLRLGQR